MKSTEWLTEVLYQSDVLKSGEVVSAEKRRDNSTPFSNRIIFLDLTFSPDANPDRPRSIVYKSQDSVKEYYFYSELLKKSSDVPALDYYFCHHNPRQNRSVLLFPDISTSYTQTQWPVPPADDDCEKAIIALAQLHAAWWNRRELAEAGKILTGENSWTDRYRVAIRALSEFFDFLGDRISSQRRSIYEKTIPVVENTFNRRDKVTLIHGDAHFWNFLFSNNGTENGVKLIDWRLWDIGAPTDDLAYMMGLHWYPERRERLERNLLETYHHTIIGKGVQAYSLEDLWEDYRLSCIRNMFIPVWQWAKGIHPSVWWFHFERSFLTYNDLSCGELLC